MADETGGAAKREYGLGPDSSDCWSIDAISVSPVAMASATISPPRALWPPPSRTLSTNTLVRIGMVSPATATTRPSSTVR